MTEASQKYIQKTLQGSPSATSSQESEAGLLPCSSQESATEHHSGPEAPHASRLVLPESNSASLMSDTSPPLLCGSLTSAALQSSLASRLRQQLENTGSMIYSLSWKDKVTPAGRPYCQRQASVPRTKETDCSLVRSNRATPIVNDTTGSTHCYSGPDRKICLKLPGQAKLAAWPTPTTRDHKDGSECLNVPTNSLLGREVWKANWPTPRARDNHTEGQGQHSPSLPRLVEKVAPPGPVRITASGQMLTGSDAGMENSGQLSPAHSRWLMGFPPEWDDCAVMAMPSSRKSPPNSSPLSWVPQAMRLKAKK